METPLESRAAVVVLLLLAGLVMVAGTAPLTDADTSSQQEQPNTDHTVTRVATHADGSAQWTIQIRTRLDTDERVEEYEAFRERFEANRSQYLDPFRERMQNVVANAANATGRDMEALNFSARTSIQEVPRRWGIVTYEFRWTNFAKEDGDDLVVGDVFEGNFFLAANDTFEYEAPDGYAIESVEPSPHEQSSDVVSWRGREDFADGHPRAVFSPEAGQEPVETGDTPAANDGLGGAILLGALGIVALAGVAFLTVYRRKREEEAVVAGDEREESDAESGGAETEGSTVAAESAPTPDDEDTGGSTILTEEERVLDLLEHNGGRMRQAEIAEAMDWSASKTSRTIGQMAEDGDVDKIQIGRENLVALPGEVD